MHILKFGGSSVADADGLLRAAGVAAACHARRPVAVVVSAMGGVTDALLAAASDAATGGDGWRDRVDAVRARHVAAYAALGQDVPESFEFAWRDLLADAGALIGGDPGAAACFSGWGERLVVDLFARALARHGVLTEAFPQEPVVLEDAEHGRPIGAADGAWLPRPSILATRAQLVPRLSPLVMRGGVPVLPGYIARDASGRATVLGRNGSDFSATIVAAALGAEAVTIFSDVAGVFTANPRVVPGANLVPMLTYGEARAIAERGAKVLHPRTTEPLARWGIPLWLRATAAPDAPGTDVLPDVAAATETRAPSWVVAARPVQERDDADALVTLTQLGPWPASMGAADGEPPAPAATRVVAARRAAATQRALDAAGRAWARGEVAPQQPIALEPVG